MRCARPDANRRAWVGPADMAITEKREPFRRLGMFGRGIFRGSTARAVGGMNSACAALPGAPQQRRSSPCLLLLSLFSATASSAGESRYHKRAVRYQHDCLSGKRANWNCRLAREWSVSRVEVTKLQVRASWGSTFPKAKLETMGAPRSAKR